MAVRKIIGQDNPTLRKRAKKVRNFGPKFQTLVDDMVETMLDAPGVGLAAPQVDVSQRVIVVQLPGDEEGKEAYGEEAGKLYVVANPQIIKMSKTLVEGTEGCLSIPGYEGTVDRYEKVTVTGFDRHGEPLTVKAADWLARVFQHEIDHLDGRLYIDIASEVHEVKPEDEPEETIEAESEEM